MAAGLWYASQTDADTDSLPFAHHLLIRFGKEIEECGRVFVAGVAVRMPAANKCLETLFGLRV